jgi:hypothetical protein
MFDNTNSQYWRGRAWGKPAGESGTERGTGSGRSEITSQASLGGSLPAPPGGPEDADRYAGVNRGSHTRAQHNSSASWRRQV